MEITIGVVVVLVIIVIVIFAVVVVVIVVIVVATVVIVVNIFVSPVSFSFVVHGFRFQSVNTCHQLTRSSVSVQAVALRLLFCLSGVFN